MNAFHNFNITQRIFATLLKFVRERYEKITNFVNPETTSKSEEIEYEVCDPVTTSNVEIPAVHITSNDDPSNTKGETVSRIIEMQNTDGSWNYDETLIKDIGANAKDVKTNQPVDFDDETWMTTFIHGVYTTQIPDRYMEWSLSDDKAKRYIVNCVKESSIMDEIKSGNNYEGHSDIDGVMNLLVEKAVKVLKTKNTQKSTISTKEVDDFNEKENSRKNTREIHFVIDRSGSMEGPKMKDAKRCLKILIKGMPVKCTFQIYGFGTKFERSFESPQEYNNQTCDAACKLTSNMEANLGGTDLIGPLKDIYRLPLLDNVIRIIVILTDGCLDDLGGVVSLVRKNGNANKIFSVGIGEDVCEELVKSIAEEGFGKFVFVKESKDLTANLNQLFKVALEVD